jgi:toxin-antitoxin system PIN domain toxin
MILVDANLLVYAHVRSFGQHEPARAWLEEVLGGTARVALPWSSLLAFVRLVTNPRVFPEPESVAGAWQQVEAWLDAPPAWTPSPTAQHRQLLADRLAVSGLRANDVPDADLAALASGHGLRLATSDSGFARFDGLDWFNPLQMA